MILEQKSSNISFGYDEIKGIFTGYASVFNEVDRVGDTVLPNAYDKEIKAWEEGKSIPINFEHDKSIILAGNVNKMTKEGKGLLVEWTFSQEAKSLHPDIWQWAVSKGKAGKLFMSIGFESKSSLLGNKRIQLKKQMISDTLMEVELDHIAATDNPVDTKAKILEVKGLRTPKYPVDLSENWDSQSAEKNWREYTKSTEKPSTQYKNGFLYVEDGKEELFGSYHFLVVDIIDGEPMVNQRAVIAANGYLHGARNGVKILDEQQTTQILGIISILYERINRVRKENGVDLLPAVEMKSIENLNSTIKELNGKISAKRFLKENKSILSNTNIENFVDQIFKIKEFETEQKSLPKEVPVIVDKTNDFNSLMNEVASKLNNKK